MDQSKARAPYSAKSRDDLHDLAKMLALSPKGMRPAIAANLAAEGLMLPRQWWVRLGIWTIKHRHKLDTFQAWTALLSRTPQIADDLIEQAVDWITNGKDADGEGVGGFNQREIDVLVGTLLAVGSDYTKGAVAHDH